MKNLNLIIKKILSEENKDKYKQKFKGVCHKNTAGSNSWCTPKRIIPSNFFERKFHYEDGRIENGKYLWYRFGWDEEGNKVVYATAYESERGGGETITNTLFCQNKSIVYNPNDTINNPGINKTETEINDLKILFPFCNKVKWKYKKPKKLKSNQKSNATGVPRKYQFN